MDVGNPASCDFSQLGLSPFYGLRRCQPELATQVVDLSKRSKDALRYCYTARHNQLQVVDLECVSNKLSFNCYTLLHNLMTLSCQKINSFKFYSRAPHIGRQFVAGRCSNIYSGYLSVCE